MKVSGDWLSHPGTQGVLATLAGAGHQALVVGGCVRNAILGVPVSDVDIATDALPDRVAALCAASGYKVVPTGIEHGTLTVIAADRAHEITTFRHDVETDGRRATVAFARTVAEDAARRDFTMNALYAEADGTLRDPLGGLPDLLARKVRFVGDASDRIREDYLRILRFFRFHAWYGDPEVGMDPQALDAVASGLDGLDRLSRERVGQEMRKLLGAPDPAPAVAVAQATGVLARLLPGADSRALAPLVHLEAGLPPRWLRRLAVLGDTDAADRLRLSRAEARTLERIQAAMTMTPEEAAFRHGAETARDAMLATAAAMGVALPPDWLSRIRHAADQRFPVRASDLMPALQGAALGQMLSVLERRWIESGFTLDRAALLANRPARD